ncbi:MAG TPA: LysM peptidoglycan-binding domain-containing protein [Opitutaceae bacterium]|nr:LysM peptidoglycan-binding domain-containing protein [Opitutaceae bacterium]
MRPRRILQPFVAPLLLGLLSGCGYVHLGRMPAPPEPTVIGDDKLLKENSDLRLEKKMLQQELAIAHAQGDALRTVVENRNADGDTSRRLTEQLTASSRELAELRASYAKLAGERDQAVASAGESTALRARLGEAEEKLAGSLRTYTDLQAEVGRLRTEVDRTHAENLSLSAQVKTITAQNAEAQAALAQLNTQLLAQKDARARAEQDAETLRSALQAAAPNASALAQQRTGAAGEARSLAAEQAAEISSLRQELDRFRGQVDTLAAERDQLKQQLASAAPAAELADIQARLATALDQLKAARSDLVAANSAKSDLETQLAQFKNRAAPAADPQGLRDQLREAQATAAALGEENARLKTRLAAARALSGEGRPGADANRVNLGAIDVTGAKSPGGAPVADAPRADAPAPAAAPANASIAHPPASGVSAMLVTNVSGQHAPPVRTELANASGQPRFHIVASGDTLAKISALYYGTPSRWSDILAANRDILGENNNLVIGRTLRIP